MTRSFDRTLLFRPERSSSLYPGYVEYFALAQPPFDSAADSRFVYPCRSYAAVRAQLLESLQRREGLVVLTGASGTGKTTLCRSVASALPCSVFVSDVVDPFLTPDDLVKQVLIDFGVLSSETVGAGSSAGISYHDRVLMLRHFLEGSQPEAARFIIVIDDAHQVQPRVLAQLRALINLQEGTDKSLQVVLVGQPSLDLLLQQPEVHLAERVVRRCHLGGLARDEIHAYIQYRLAAARPAPRSSSMDDLSQPDSQPVDDATLDIAIRRAALTLLAALSGGVPRTLNLLCDRALDVAFEQRTHEIGPAIIKKAARRLNLPIPFVRRVDVRYVTLALGIVVLTTIAGGLWTSRRVWFPRLNVLNTSAPQRQSLPALLPPAPVATGPARVETAPSGLVSAGKEILRVEALETADSFTIVVASFKSQQNAAETVAELTDLDLPAYVRDDGVWRVVSVGPYFSMDEATDALKRIPTRKYAGTHIRKQAAAHNTRQ